MYGWMGSSQHPGTYSSSLYLYGMRDGDLCFPSEPFFLFIQTSFVFAVCLGGCSRPKITYSAPFLLLKSLPPPNNKQKVCNKKITSQVPMISMQQGFFLLHKTPYVSNCKTSMLAHLLTSSSIKNRSIGLTQSL